MSVSASLDKILFSPKIQKNSKKKNQNNIQNAKKNIHENEKKYIRKLKIDLLSHNMSV